MPANGPRPKAHDRAQYSGHWVDRKSFAWPQIVDDGPQKSLGACDRGDAMLCNCHSGPVDDRPVSCRAAKRCLAPIREMRRVCGSTPFRSLPDVPSHSGRTKRDRTPRRARRCVARNPAIRRRQTMKWITRERVKVDRVACPWLIKKFVDAEAEFLFVPADQVLSVAKRENAIPFDIEGVELGHHGPECSFDAILRKHGITDLAVLELAKIV